MSSFWFRSFVRAYSLTTDSYWSARPRLERPMEFLKTLSDVEVFEEETARFECEIDKEGVAAKWLKDGKKLPLNNQIKAESDGKKQRLVIKDCRLDDEAYYTCVVGERKTSASLTVKGNSYKRKSWETRKKQK